MAFTVDSPKGSAARVLDTPLVADDYPGLAGSVVFYSGTFANDEMGFVAPDGRIVWLFADEVVAA